MENRYDVVRPYGRSTSATVRLAKRLDTLEGKVVVQLWDRIFKGDIMFAALEAELPKRFPGIRFVSWKEFDNFHGAGEADLLASLPERFKELGVDAVICGSGC
ncbi:hypothetical protein H7F51_01360 [Novosphingobium flavum]|uniref:UGSC-like domain-containing protein n=2 Tax=Novosphingobium flavum TaxID=1778672 RepID=A0A7X1FNP2_9SPHN|nr:hypothetical protein [Novosphingobium flavum]MBC2664159.1 hypothetical protein [Novosphingobium flavum]